MSGLDFLQSFDCARSHYVRVDRPDGMDRAFTVPVAELRKGEEGRWTMTLLETSPPKDGLNAWGRAVGRAVRAIKVLQA